MYYHCKNLHQAVKCEKSEENKKAKMLWAMKEAQDRGVETRAKLRLSMWAIHAESPTAALAKALESLEHSERTSPTMNEYKKKRKRRNIFQRKNKNGKHESEVTRGPKITRSENRTLYSRNLSTNFFGFGVCSNDWKKQKWKKRKMEKQKNTKIEKTNNRRTTKKGQTRKIEKMRKLVMKRHSVMGEHDKMTSEPWSAFMIKMHLQQQWLGIGHTLLRKRHLCQHPSNRK